MDLVMSINIKTSNVTKSETNKAFECDIEY